MRAPCRRWKAARRQQSWLAVAPSTAYDVGRDGRIVVRASTPDRPYEIFAVENDELRC